jgi:anti-sigma B factor antagonist
MARFDTPLLRVTPAGAIGGRQLALDGELDLATVPVLEEGLAAAEVAGDPVVALDLTHLDFVDASGLKAILNAHRRALRSGRAGLTLLHPSSDVRRLLSLTAIDLTIEVRDFMPSAA